MTDKFTPWSTLAQMRGSNPEGWPEDEGERIASYDAYDKIYWNDPTQYAIRILEDEQPLYVPNGRIVVDTTAHYLMKGLTVNSPSKDPKESEQQFLMSFLKRERFYSRFSIGKKTGITRGDWAFHVTADPLKAPGSRVSLTLLHPGKVWKESDPDDSSKIVRIHIGELWEDPEGQDGQQYMKVLTYEKVMVDGKRRIAREESAWELTPDWWGDRGVKYKTFLQEELLPEEIDQFPVYWYNNIEWEDQLYGSSELRGLEFLAWAASQGATDVQMALALDGLGVYATDGGRPVDDDDVESDWEVAPGKVMEVPSGSYFRRVEGLGSITPALEQINYIESKMFRTASITDVALGNVDVQVAQSGIALAIRFAPTLAKIADRDTAGVEITQQLFFDLRKWFQAYEGRVVQVEYDVSIDVQKLPPDRTAILNELNNMLDRKAISLKFYREKMVELGYSIPEDVDQQLLKEAEAMAKINQTLNPVNAGMSEPDDGTQSDSSTLDEAGNRSNNRNRPNESSGTEAGQSLERQAKAQ